ncbi:MULTISPECIES: LysR family transcriptional regulator [Actinoplanes]|uniref:LysR family transcriptional regulator n=1 Tax=Actinoplanes TaxID=1865 RepID=UPI0005F2BA99|nr:MULTISPECIES: LysR family transcriptional regulator [Actinoplanes]GLY00374.1 LysR family transcriptional regulator [Actinoplanes sp. NBRC 101535]
MADDPGQLRLLALIRRHGSLAGAADELGVTGAAVSGQVARAERDWGTALVVRGPRGARLTEPGQVLADAGEVIVAQTRRARERVTAMLGPLSRRLRIGAFPTAAQHLLPPALTALRHLRPDAELTITEIVSEQGPELVDAGTLDVAVVSGYAGRPVVAPGVRVTPVLVDPMVLCLPDDHRLAGRRHRISLGDLAGDPWIVIVAGHAARQQLDRAAAEAGFRPAVQFETENYNVAQALVATGIGVTMLSRLTVASTPGVVHRDLASPRLDRQVYALSSTGVPSADVPLADHFVALLTQVGADLTENWIATPLR